MSEQDRQLDAMNHIMRSWGNACAKTRTIHGVDCFIAISIPSDSHRRKDPDIVFNVLIDVKSELSDELIFEFEQEICAHSRFDCRIYTAKDVNSGLIGREPINPLVKATRTGLEILFSKGAV